MSAMRRFHLGDVLSVTTGRLLSPTHMDGVHQILDYMTGDTLFSHQLPRAMDECAPALRRQHPQLAGIHVPQNLEGKDAVAAWLAEQVAIYGEHPAVEPLAAEAHTHIDPIAELRMLGVPTDRILPVIIDGGEGA